LRWALINAIVLALMIVGLRGHKTAWNVFVFVQWFATIVCVLVFLAKEAPFVKDSPGRSVSNWVEATFDFGVALALAAFGHFGYAAMSLLQYYSLLCYY